MDKIFNIKSQKKYRQKLRNDPTPQEVILWSRLKNNQMGVKFRRQHGIGNYIVDFCCSSNKLVVEIDGSEHLDTDNYDQNRTIYLNNLGYKVLRFWNNEINKNLNGVIIKIAENLANKK